MNADAASRLPLNDSLHVGVDDAQHLDQQLDLLDPADDLVQSIAFAIVIRIGLEVLRAGRKLVQ